MNDNLKKLLLWMVPGLAAVVMFGWTLATKQIDRELASAAEQCSARVAACEQHADEQIELFSTQHEASKVMLSSQVAHLRQEVAQLQGMLFREVMEDAAEAVMGMGNGDVDR